MAVGVAWTSAGAVHHQSGARHGPGSTDAHPRFRLASQPQLLSSSISTKQCNHDARGLVV